MSEVPSDVDRMVYAYGDYRDYITAQRRRGLRSRGVTRRYTWYRQRIGEKVRELCPTASTMLCLGARSDLEVLDFERMGFQAQGIDLFASKRIIECDMTKLDQHPHFNGKSFDVFMGVHSIEHCLNFADFRRCLKMCTQALACVTPQLTGPTAWDCSAFRFAHPEANSKDLALAFPGFRVGWRDVVKRTLMFVLVREADQSNTPIDVGGISSTNPLDSTESGR